MTSSGEATADLLKAYRKLRFLVVDDFENFRLSMRQMLRSFGVHNIDVASNGNEAVYKCTYERFDVILCDYNLGDGKNGQQILEEIRHKKLLKHTSIFIMITAETSRDMVMGAREYEPDTYLTKPLTRASLQKRLDALIVQRDALYDINHEIDLENLPKAISLCEQKINSLPRYRTWILKTLGELYRETGDYSHAHKIYRDVLSQRDLPWARLGESKVFIAEQAYDEAIASLEELIEKSPDLVEAYDLLAKALKLKGRGKKAQDVLGEAVRLSPRGLLRQQQYAEVATSNQDLETAAKAWRNTVKLADHSVHESSEQYLNLGRCLCDLSEGDTSSGGKQLASEAINTLSQMERKFKDDAKAKVMGGLVESRVHAGQGRTADSRKLLERLKSDIDLESVDANTGLELAKTLYAVGDEGEAQSVLGKLAERFEDNQDVVDQVEALMDEPVGFQKKLRARSLNREAIKAFEEGNLDEAAKYFSEALEMVPRHPALNLNLVQVLLKQGKPDTATLKQCKSRLDQIAHLPPQHRQYKRYAHLLGKVEKMLQGDVKA
ncbi:response regulator [Marinobacteraceae bacterium S3BR75-40.1]